MREEIRKTKKLTEKPFGVNLIPTPENDIWTPPILQVIKEEGVKAVVYTGYGDGAIITSLFNELKASGISSFRMNLRNSFSSKFLNAYLYFSEKAFSINKTYSFCMLFVILLIIYLRTTTQRFPSVVVLIMCILLVMLS